MNKNLLIILIYFVCVNLYAQTGLIPVVGSDAQATSLGNSVTTIGNASMLYTNFSMSTFNEATFKASISYVPLRTGVDESNELFVASSSMVLGERHGIGIGYRQLSLAAYLQTDNQGNLLGEFKPNESIIDIAYSYKLATNWALGVGLHHLNINLSDEFSSSATTFDLNLYGKFKSFSIGITAINLGGNVKSGDTSISLPQKINGGIEYLKKLSDTHTFLTTSNFGYLKLTEEQKGLNAGIGLQYGFRQLIHARTGYYYTDDTIDWSHLNIGVGISAFGGAIDFAYLLTGDGQKDRYLITLSWGF